MGWSRILLPRTLSPLQRGSTGIRATCCPHARSASTPRNGVFHSPLLVVVAAAVVAAAALLAFGDGVAAAVPLEFPNVSLLLVPPSVG